MGEEDRFAGALAEMARSCSDTTVLRRWTLAQIAALLPIDSAIFLSPRLREAPSSINKEEFHKLYWNYARDPERYRRGLEKGRWAAQALGGAYIDTEVFSAAERRELPLYAEMVRPQGINCQIVARPMFHGRSTGLLYLCRHGTGRFRACELEQVVRILPIVALSHVALDSLAGRPGPDLDATDPDPRQVLTPRENQIVELVCRGLTNAEIAAVLGNRPNTVRNQLASICAKLEVTNRTELVGVVSAHRAGTAAEHP
jgi:DNA-binding CsgD family transcriptional regulator